MDGLCYCFAHIHTHTHARACTHIHTYIYIDGERKHGKGGFWLLCMDGRGLDWTGMEWTGSFGFISVGFRLFVGLACVDVVVCIIAVVAVAVVVGHKISMAWHGNCMALGDGGKGEKRRIKIEERRKNR